MPTRHSFRRGYVVLLVIVFLAGIAMLLNVAIMPSMDTGFEGDVVLRQHLAGSEVKRMALSESPETLKSLNGWLKSQPTAWCSFNTYVPNVVVASDHLRVNFVANVVVIEQRESVDGVWHQYERSSTPTDRHILADLKALLNAVEPLLE